MSGTPNLGLTYSVEGQIQPTVPINYDWNLLDGVLGPAAAFGNNPNTTSGLTYGYYGANLSTGAVAGGTLTLAANATNYIQRTAAGVVSANTTGFTQIPLAQVITGASLITSVADKRQPDAYGLANPMTSLGDLIMGLAGGAASRLPIGAQGQVLTVTSGASGLAAAWGASGMSNPMTTSQDLIVGGTSGSPGRLGVGAAGQVLGVTSSGTVAWLNNPAGFTNPMTNAGDMIVGGPSGSATALASGAAGQVLTSTASGVAWQNSPAGFSNPMTTAGDLILGGTGGAAGRLGTGTSGQVLTVDSTTGLPTWKAPTGGGSALSINAQTSGAYTLAASDAPSTSNFQGIVTMNNAAANTVNVPSSGTVAWQPGTQIQVVQLGAGQTACAAASGVTLNTPSSLTARAQYSTLVLTYYGSNVWVLGGDMT